MNHVIHSGTENWQDMTVGDVITLQRGYDITKAEQSNGPYPVISSSGPTSTHSSYKVAAPGVVIGRKGSLGGVYYSGAPFWPHDTTLWVKDFRSNDPKFVYYWLQTLGLERYDVGASNPTLNRNHLHLLPASIPGKETQRKIAAVLSAYDDLIECNSRRLALLEEIGRRIYNEWFVDFRYPAAETVPLQDSELGPIPDGWQTISIGEWAKVVVGSTPSRKKSEYWRDGNVPWINSSQINDLCVITPTELITQEAYESSSTKMMPVGATLVAITGATLGQVSYLAIDACGSQNVGGVIPLDPAESPYIYFAINRTIGSITSRAMGGAQQHINRRIIQETLLIKPAKDTLSEFCRITQPILDYIVTLLRCQRALRASRDFLLPRVVSGEVDVTNLEIEMPEAM
jgi:type I restriction enzyme, S subunit